MRYLASPRWSLHVGVIAALFSAMSAQAELLVYEGFNYAANSSLSGASGGTGWSGNWTTVSGTAPSIESGSLAVGDLVTTGNKAVSNTAGSTMTRNFDVSGVRDDSFGNAGNPQSLWMSFTFDRQAGTGATNTIGMNWSNGTQDRLLIGRFTGSTDWQIGTTGLTGTISRPNPVAFDSNSNTLFALVRVDLRATTGTQANQFDAYLWLYDSTLPSTAPSTSAAASQFLSGANTTTAGYFTSLRVNNTSTRSAAFDEIRIGTSFADVVVAVPEPGTYGIIFGAALIGLALVRRRRREA